jgi:hypothetical protein
VSVRGCGNSSQPATLAHLALTRYECVVRWLTRDLHLTTLAGLALTVAALGCNDGSRPTARPDASVREPAAERTDAATLDAGAPECTVKIPSVCEAPKPHYADVQPIIAARCLGCHDGSGEQWSLIGYEHVADWYIEIRSMISRCSMPPPDSGISMPNQERETILRWLRCGYPK